MAWLSASGFPRALVEDHCCLSATDHATAGSHPALGNQLGAMSGLFIEEVMVTGRAGIPS